MTLEQEVHRWTFWSGAAAGLACAAWVVFLALLLLGCASPWRQVGSYESVTRCSICGWPTQLMDTELTYSAQGKRKVVVTWYQCWGLSCQNVDCATNVYVRIVKP